MDPQRDARRRAVVGHRLATRDAGQGVAAVRRSEFRDVHGPAGIGIVAGGMLYRADGVVGLSNVVSDAADAVAVWRSLSLLATKMFPRMPLVGYELGSELQAALDAGFEIGDPLRVWVRSPGERPYQCRTHVPSTRTPWPCRVICSSESRIFVTPPMRCSISPECSASVPRR